MYVTQLPQENWQGIGWVFLNSAIAVVDRLLQRLLLSKVHSQQPLRLIMLAVFIDN